MKAPKGLKATKLPKAFLMLAAAERPLVLLQGDEGLCDAVGEWFFHACGDSADRELPAPRNCSGMVTRLKDAAADDDLFILRPKDLTAALAMRGFDIFVLDVGPKPVERDLPANVKHLFIDEDSIDCGEWYAAGDLIERALA